MDSERTIPNGHVPADDINRQPLPLPQAPPPLPPLDPPALAYSSDTSLVLEWKTSSLFSWYILESGQHARPSEGQSKSKGGRQQPSADAFAALNWVVVYEGDSKRAQVTSLRPGVRYSFRLRGIPAAVPPLAAPLPPPPSEVVSFSTQARTPDAPLHPTLTTRARNMLKLKWAAPVECGGLPIEGYLLIMQQPNKLEGGLQGDPDSGDARQPGDDDGAPMQSGGLTRSAHYGITTPVPEGYSLVYAGMDTQFKITRLVPGEVYSFRVLAWNQLGDSPFSEESVFRTSPSVPAQPLPPCVLSVTESTIAVAWEETASHGSPITSYILEIDDGSGGGGPFMPVYNGDDLWCEVPNLRSGLCYRLRLFAENVVGRSMASAPVEARMGAAPPQPPRPPTVGGAGASFITLAWGPPQDDGGARVSSYELEVSRAGHGRGGGAKSMQWEVGYSGDKTACTLQGLIAGREYCVRLRCKNEAGWGRFSADARVSTAPAAPDAPPLPVLTSRAQNSLLLQLVPPAHDGGQAITGYRLDYTPYSTDMSSCGQVPSQFDFSLLVPCGSSTSSNNANATRPSSAAPSSKSGAGPAAAGGAAGSSAGADASRGEAGESVTLRDLAPGVAYAIRVRAVNASGASPPSEVLVCDTRGACPAAPARPERDGTPTATSVKIRWTPPDSHGAPILSYFVECCLQAACPRRAVTDTIPEANGHPAQLPAANGDASHELDAAGEASAAAGAGPCSDAAAAAASALRGFPEGNFARGAAGAGGEDGDGVTAGSGSSGGGGGGPASGGWGGGGGARSGKGAPMTQEGETGGGKYKGVYEGRDPQCVVASLAPASTYLLRVKAANKYGHSAWSDTLQVKTAPSQPGAPPPPEASAVSTTTIHVRWKAPSHDNGAPVTQYTLQVAEKLDIPPTVAATAPTFSGTAASSGGGAGLGAAASGKAKKKSSVAAAGAIGGAALLPPGLQPAWRDVYVGLSCEFEFSHAESGQEYLFRVCAANSAGVGPFSNDAIAAPCAAPPAAPAPPQLVAVGPMSVRLRWSPPLLCRGSPVTSYILEVSSDPLTGFKKVFTGAPTSFKVTKLLPTCTYFFRVKAVNAVGVGPASNVASTTLPLAPPPAPSAPTLDSATPTSLRISWVAADAEDLLALASAPQGIRSSASSGAAPSSSGAATSSSAAAANALGVAGAAIASMTPDMFAARSHYSVEMEPVSGGGGGSHHVAAQPRVVYSGVAARCEVRDLHPATSYAFRVRAHGDASVSTSTSTPGTPTRDALARDTHQEPPSSASAAELANGMAPATTAAVAASATASGGASSTSAAAAAASAVGSAAAALCSAWSAPSVFSTERDPTETSIVYRRDVSGAAASAKQMEESRSRGGVGAGLGPQGGGSGAGDGGTLGSMVAYGEWLRDWLLASAGVSPWTGGSAPGAGGRGGKGAKVRPPVRSKRSLWKACSAYLPHVLGGLFILWLIYVWWTVPEV
eukprot:jgi/Mesvir1/12793/Mv22843-RA.1